MLSDRDYNKTSCYYNLLHFKIDELEVLPSIYSYILGTLKYSPIPLLTNICLVKSQRFGDNRKYPEIQMRHIKSMACM